MLSTWTIAKRSSHGWPLGKLARTAVCCACIDFILSFNDFFETKYVRIYWTNFHNCSPEYWMKVSLPILPKIGCHVNISWKIINYKQMPIIWWKKSWPTYFQINDKNCSLSNCVNSHTSKTAKIIKRDIAHHHVSYMSTWCWVILPFYDFLQLLMRGCFKTQRINCNFLWIIFAVFLSPTVLFSFRLFRNIYKSKWWFFNIKSSLAWIWSNIFEILCSFDLQGRQPPLWILQKIGILLDFQGGGGRLYWIFEML